ncbi:outer membrane transport energization protein ExbD [Flavobacterium croceum DSM 17960]|uniref:Outer membrane transport energization protein ExbD n=1 Tax=Flavobacterium croceum DSM 17960 TaxID=1121886 RepID=A0A2S4NA02_9FLAO|nr:biopolymer transporter ExbD [Flavobacterium croceum]POS02531.1 outer membrane transport energization protein ExbD [Flavobacterium croceum DSM 17960]
MAKIKMSKKATSIDMTAMCDVAFLLLTFFILTATAKVPEPVTVDAPSSTVKAKLPETDLFVVTVSNKGTIFVDIKGRDLRRKTLEIMQLKYKLPEFSQEEKDQFALMESFGVPVEGVRSIIKMKSSERNRAGVQTGVPYDTIPHVEGDTKNQLYEWIYAARQAYIDLGNTKKELNFAVKGDAKLQYPKIKNVMDILQEQKINTFDLVTGLRGKNY